MSLRHPTLRLTVTLIKVLCLCLLALAGPACAKQAQLRSEAVVEAFGNVPPLSMTFSGAGLGIAEARDIPVTVIAYGNGYEINVDLMLSDPQAPVTRQELARAAMSAVLTFHRIVRHSFDDDDRNAPPFRASIYQAYGDYESGVLLATALFAPSGDDTRDLAFPGPAWKEVAATERICTETELAYIQEAQLRRYDWGYHDLQGKQEALRDRITPAQDAEVSAKLGIKPGTLNMVPLVLKPL